MADKTLIEWADATWNAVTGCTLVSEGCRHCYAARNAATRLKHHPSRAGLARFNAAGEAKFTGEVRFNPQWLDQPLGWRRPRRIFVCAHGDLFHEAVPDAWIDQVFAVMALCPRHVFQVLTKRPERAREYIEVKKRRAPEWVKVPDGSVLLPYEGGIPTNVWLGTSVEDQATADARIPHLLAAPAAVRFVSAEPLLGPVDLVPGLDWVIVGGESGPGARPMHPDWARALRDQCAAAGVPFFFKQWGSWAPGLHGSVSFVAGSGASPAVCWPDGTITRDGDAADHGGNGTLIHEVGKKRAGRLLDGVEHNGMPARA